MSQRFLNLIRSGETAEVAAVAEEDPSLVACRDAQGVSAFLWSIYSRQPLIRDFLLQHLEDIGFLYKKHLIDIVNVDQLFGYYIESVFESEAIKKYTAWVRKDGNDIYSNFEGVYTALETYLSQTSK